MSKQAAQEVDVALIKETVAKLERAQQNERVFDFLRLFTAEPVWVTAHGRRLTGRDEIGEFTEQVLPGSMKERTARYEVVHISFLRPDVAVVNVRQRPVTHDGEPVQAQPEGRPVYVMTREQGQWLIAAGQNTQVKEP
jgi:uncharacterized protein (TIGR02246 family)